MIEINEISLVACVDGDEDISTVKQVLKRRGYLLPYWPHPDGLWLVSDCLSRRLPNLFTEAFGPIDEICIGYEFVGSSKGTEIRIHPCPRSAVGPSLKNLLLGTGKEVGVFSKVYLKILQYPELIQETVFSFPTKAELLQFETRIREANISFPLRARIEASPAWTKNRFAFFFSLWGRVDWVQAHLEVLENLASAFEYEASHLSHKKAEQLKNKFFVYPPPPLGEEKIIEDKINPLEKKLTDLLFEGVL